MTPFLDLRQATAELRDEIDAAIARVLSSGRYIQGPEVEAFEDEFAGYCGARHCVGVASGLDALTLLLRALGIGEGDDVIVPSNTYIATWLAVSSGAAWISARPFVASATRSFTSCRNSGRPGFDVSQWAAAICACVSPTRLSPDLSA